MGPTLKTTAAYAAVYCFHVGRARMVGEQAEKSVSATWHLYAMAAAMFFSSAVEGYDFAGKWMSLIVLALFSSALLVVFELVAVFRRVKLRGWRAALPLALLVTTVCLTPETVQAFRMLGFKQLQPRFDLIVSKVVSGEYPEKLEPEAEAYDREAKRLKGRRANLNFPQD